MAGKRAIALALWMALAGVAAPAAEHVWIEGESSTSFSFNRHGWYEDRDLRKDLMSPGVPEGPSGDWLAHYVPGNPGNTARATWDFTVTEGGDHVLWIRCNPVWAAMSLGIDGGALAPLDLDDYRELVNVVTTIDIRWLAWVKAGTFALAPGPHSVTVEAAYEARRDASHAGIDCLCLVNFPFEPAGALKPGDVIEPPGPDVWFPLRAGDDGFSPLSITDMSSLIEAPAGLHGPLSRDGNRFVFRDKPGVPVKLWGVNTGDLLPTEALQDRQARLYAKHGVNVIRLHPVESFLGVLEPDPVGGGRILNAARLDRLDRFFAVLKQRGIYMDWSCFYPHVLTADDPYPDLLRAELDDSGSGKSTAGLVSFMREMQDAEWEWLQRLLDHRNPYTGLRYADDPALAIVEVHNEDSVFWHFPLNDLAAGTRWPNHTAELKRLWMEWLAARYGTDTALAAAWGPGLRPGDSVSNPEMGIYGAWQMAASGPNLGAGVDPDERPRAGDFIRFLAETQRGYYERRIAQMRSTGFQGIAMTTAWWAGGPAAEAANLWCDDAGDAIDRHAYFGGGAGGWYVAPGTVDNDTHLRQPGRGIAGGRVYDADGLAVPLFQVEDKPTVMSEWSQSPPNEWKAESAPLHAFYGMGLQGWDAALHFAGSLPRMGSGWPSNARGPSSFVTETPHYLGQFPALVFAVRNGHLREADLAGARRVPLDQIFAGYDALSQDLPGGGYPTEPSLRTPPEAGAIGRVTFKAGDGLASAEKIDWTACWDQARQTITSTTGDLVWDYGNRFVTVRAEKTQAVIGWAGGRDIDLPGVTVHLDTAFASLIFTPLDDWPLIDSGHILITALARDKQLGAEYGPGGTDLLLVGGPPLLLEPVEASITFKGPAVLSARVVDIYGVPTAVDVERTGNTVRIDGRYEAYYYEVLRQASSRVCLCRSGTTSLSPLSPTRAEIFLGAAGPDGVSLDPAASLARVPYVCPFASGDSDPESVLDPSAGPLIFYQVSGAPALPVVVEKAAAQQTVRFLF